MGEIDKDMTTDFDLNHIMSCLWEDDIAKNLLSVDTELYSYFLEERIVLSYINVLLRSVNFLAHSFFKLILSALVQL